MVQRSEASTRGATLYVGLSGVALTYLRLSGALVRWQAAGGELPAGLAATSMLDAAVAAVEAAETRAGLASRPVRAYILGSGFAPVCPLA